MGLDVGQVTSPWISLQVTLWKAERRWEIRRGAGRWHRPWAITATTSNGQLQEKGRHEARTGLWRRRKQERGPRLTSKNCPGPSGCGDLPLLRSPGAIQKAVPNHCARSCGLCAEPVPRGSTLKLMTKLGSREEGRNKMRSMRGGWGSTLLPKEGGSWGLDTGSPMEEGVEGSDS